MIAFQLGIVLGAGVGPLPAVPASPAKVPITISVGTLIDGRGGRIERGATVVIEGNRIVRVEPDRIANPTYTFPNGTALPGLIDVHAHPATYEQGRLHALGDGDDSVQAALAVKANLERTLTAGFTTVQSIGSPADLELRAAIAADRIVGPRLVTSLAPIMNASLSADLLRALVRARAKAGAEAIKLFASRSLGDGGAPTMSEEQLAAICGEARAQGIRSVTHAHGAEAIRRAVMAGCGQIEHGVFADQDVIRLMAERGTYFDPQCAAVFENYIEHRTSWFAGSNYATPDGLALLERALVLGPQVTRMALATPGLKLVFGTDAVATGNGRSVDDIGCRVRKAGQGPMDAIVTATSRNAEALGIGNETGSIVPGLNADLIVVDGDPLRDIGALSKVVLVIKDGRVRYQ